MESLQRQIAVAQVQLHGATIKSCLRRERHFARRQHVIAQGLVAEISGATLWRWLSSDALRPWQHRSLIFPRDPNFAAKAGPVLDLYQRIWDGLPVGADDFVVCFDEKTSIQARRRKQPTLPPASDRVTRVEHEYFCDGAWTYLAAWDVHRAKVFGRCEIKSGIAPVDRLVSEVMSQEHYKSARRVFWIMDNCSAHGGQKAVDRLRSKWPNPLLLHTPIHASWLTRSRSTSRSFSEKSSRQRFLLSDRTRTAPACIPVPLRAHCVPLSMDIHSSRPLTLLAKISNKRLAPAA